MAATVVSCSKDDDGAVTGSNPESLVGVWKSIYSISYEKVNGDWVQRSEQNGSPWGESHFLTLCANGRFSDESGDEYIPGYYVSDEYWVYKNDRIYYSEVKGKISGAYAMWYVVSVSVTELILFTEPENSTWKYMIHYTKISDNP